MSSFIQVCSSFLLPIGLGAAAGPFLGVRSVPDIGRTFQFLHERLGRIHNISYLVGRHNAFFHSGEVGMTEPFVRSWGRFAGQIRSQTVLAGAMVGLFAAVTYQGSGAHEDPSPEMVGLSLLSSPFLGGAAAFATHQIGVALASDIDLSRIGLKQCYLLPGFTVAGALLLLGFLLYMVSPFLPIRDLHPPADQASLIG